MEKLEKKQIIQYLVASNTTQFNILKAIEECQELGLILTQYLTKPHKVTEDDITDEIGDVIIRLKILKEIFPKGKIKKRVNDKLILIYNDKKNKSLL